MRNNTRVVVFLGLLVALYVILNIFFEIPLSPTSRIRLGFFPLSFAAALFGPLAGGIVGAAGDVLAWLYSPKGPYFPGLTFSALISGVLYGLFLFRKPKSIVRITLAVLLVTVFIDIGLNTYWMTILYGKGFFVVLPPRLLKSVIMIPVQIGSIYWVWKYAGSLIESRFVRNQA